MEIGHNVLHGQWDWMNDPYIHSSTWDWDTASTSEAWKHSHNYVHHTYTNIRGKDKDLGYEIMRIDPHQKWHPVYLAQPFYNILLMLFFEWGVAFHDLDFEAIRKGEKSKEQLRRELKGIAGKARSQIVKDYIAWPLISALAVAAVEVARDAARADAGAGGASAGADPRRDRPRRRCEIALRQRARDLPHDAARRTSPPTSSATSGPTRSSSAATSPTRPTPSARRRSRTRPAAAGTSASSSARRTSRAARSSTSVSGNLGYQVEHHLFPDMPSTRYAEIAPRVKEICERYELPYNTGPFVQQLGMVQRTILRLAFPGGKPRPKPGPYRGGDTEGVQPPETAARRPARGRGRLGPEQAGRGRARRPCPLS